MGVFAQQQNDTMFIHKEQTITAIPTQYIDSIVPQIGANATQDSLHIFRNNAVTARFSVQDIDSIIFYRAEEPIIPDIPVTGVSLNYTEKTLEIGDDVTLIATVLPSDATNPDVSWSSNNEAVATVDEYGVVTAIAEGTADITVTTEDSGLTATSVITVNPEEPQPPVIPGCNQETPNWGNSLGEVSFVSDQEWPIGNQIWSDVVTAIACQKDTYDPGTYPNLNADCRRNNPNLPDLFSWCAVARFAEELCVYPWRVPTVQDFINLDIALGGNGQNRNRWSANQGTVNGHTIQTQLTWYTDNWGGVFGGRTTSSGSAGLTAQGSYGTYWSLSEWDTRNAYSLHFSTFGVGGAINPQDPRPKITGHALRCVR